MGGGDINGHSSGKCSERVVRGVLIVFVAWSSNSFNER
jgi:hypothetical protein